MSSSYYIIRLLLYLFVVRLLELCTGDDLVEEIVRFAMLRKRKRKSPALFGKRGGLKMSFLWTQMLWLLILAPVLVLVYLLLQRRRHKYALRYASLSLVKDALGKGPGLRRHIPAIIFLIGVTVLLVAVARPVATVTLPSEQGTVILTMDVSRSMQADDVKPSRLEAAKAAAQAFVQNQPKSVYIGIVSFSNNASLVQAPTTNRDEVLAAINRLTPQSGTAIGQGILTSLNAIAEQTGDPGLIFPAGHLDN